MTFDREPSASVTSSGTANVRAWRGRPVSSPLPRDGARPAERGAGRAPMQRCRAAARLQAAVEANADVRRRLVAPGRRAWTLAAAGGGGGARASAIAWWIQAAIAVAAGRAQMDEVGLEPIGMRGGVAVPVEDAQLGMVLRGSGAARRSSRRTRAGPRAGSATARAGRRGREACRGRARRRRRSVRQVVVAVDDHDDRAELAAPAVDHAERRRHVRAVELAALRRSGAGRRRRRSAGRGPPTAPPATGRCST